MKPSLKVHDIKNIIAITNMKENTILVKIMSVMKVVIVKKVVTPNRASQVLSEMYWFIGNHSLLVLNRKSVLASLIQ